MASIPLAANQIRPAPEIDPLSMYLHVTQLQNAMTEGAAQRLGLQKATLELQDTQNMRKAWQDAQGDPDKYLDNLKNSNIDPKNYYNQQQFILDQRKKMADLQKVQNENAAAQNDQYRGRILSIVNGPEQQKQAQWDSEIAAEEKAGTIQPGMVSHIYPGDDVATSIANHYALGSVLQKEAAENKRRPHRTSDRS